MRVAAKWNYLIQRFRTDVSALQIASEWNAMPEPMTEDERLLRFIFDDYSVPKRQDTLSADQVRSVVQKIVNVATGLTQDGETRGKRGRPKKVTDSRPSKSFQYNNLWRTPTIRNK